MKLVDTSVLLNARASDSPGHERARAWLEAALRGRESVAFAWVALLGFARISTRPQVYDAPLSPAEALSQVDEWLAAPPAVVVHPGSEHASILRELLVEAGTAGNLTTDAHLAALAIENGAALASFDGDFQRFAGLRHEYLR